MDSHFCMDENRGKARISCQEDTNKKLIKINDDEQNEDFPEVDGGTPEG